MFTKASWKLCKIFQGDNACVLSEYLRQSLSVLVRLLPEMGIAP